MRTHGVKGNQKIALVGRLYRQYCTPSEMQVTVFSLAAEHQRHVA